MPRCSRGPNVVLHQAERDGQSEAIATNLTAMAGLRVPIVCVIMGEGGSGGALGVGMGNRVGMLSRAYFGVVRSRADEGCLMCTVAMRSFVSFACVCRSYHSTMRSQSTSLLPATSYLAIKRTPSLVAASASVPHRDSSVPALGVDASCGCAVPQLLDNLSCP